MGVFNFRGFKRSNDVTVDKSTLRMLTETGGMAGITWSGISSLKNSDVFTAIDIIDRKSVV